MVALYRRLAPKRILEIGTWDGGTLRVWLTEGTPEVVVACDLKHRHPENYPDWTKPETELHVITGDSQFEETREQIRPHAPFDWIFIDGDHGDQGVNRDYEFCRSVIAKGGTMIFHDIQPQSGVPSYPPGTLVDKLEHEGYRVERYVDPEPQLWAHGIGVVYGF